jgi:hypothetical protein
LTNPSHYIINHRKKELSEDNEPQVNLDFLDMIEIEAHGRKFVDDHIVFGTVYAGTITCLGRYRKVIMLKEEQDLEIIIHEFIKRLPKSFQVQIDQKNEQKRTYWGLNSGNANWHSATELWRHHSKNLLHELLNKLDYEIQDFKSLKLTTHKEMFGEKFLANLYFRLIQHEPGYYEFTEDYPKFQRLSKNFVKETLARRVKHGIQLHDNSWGVYFVDNEKKLYAVNPINDNN